MRAMLHRREHQIIKYLSVCALSFFRSWQSLSWYFKFFTKYRHWSVPQESSSHIHTHTHTHTHVHPCNWSILHSFNTYVSQMISFLEFLNWKFVDFFSVCITATCLTHLISFDLMVSIMLLMMIVMMMRRWWWWWWWLRWYGCVDVNEYVQRAHTLNVVTGNDVILTWDPAMGSWSCLQGYLLL
jgi:hypothetical protein